MSHVLESDAAEREYFERQSKNGSAAWRRAVRALTGGLPTWARSARVHTQGKVDTLEGRYSADEPKVDTLPHDDPANAVTLPPGFSLPVDPSDEDEALNAFYS